MSKASDLIRKALETGQRQALSKKETRELFRELNANARKEMEVERRANLAKLRNLNNIIVD